MVKIFTLSSVQIKDCAVVLILIYLNSFLKQVDFKMSQFVTLGKKGATLTAKMGGETTADFSEQVPFMNNVSAIFKLMLEGYKNQNYNKIFLVYNHFVSTFKIIPTITQLLPISFEEISKEKKSTETYLIEPLGDEIINNLLQDYIKEKITGAILESEAAFYSSQMMAMKNATDNAGDIITNLNS